MRHNCEVKLFQVDALGLRIVCEDLRIVAGIEQDALPAVFDQGREAPILPHRGGLTESIVKDGDLGCARLRIRWRGDNCSRRVDRQCSHIEKDIPSHAITPATARANAPHVTGKQKESSAENITPYSSPPCATVIPYFSKFT